MHCDYWRILIGMEMDSFGYEPALDSDPLEDVEPCGECDECREAQRASDKAGADDGPHGPERVM